ncbi:phosphoglycolate phosphatase-like HAD superfamily hydrolase [Kroppenstedtia sanguinis]|uniref:HAD family hydrolase n=1 Tax=Kroppenstedtia sanguinis TaxID=1380684 RepID=A0ABW4CBY6_9BACL
MSKNQGKAFIFDLDGTLFQTEQVAIPAFHRTYQQLQEQGLYQGDRPADEQVTSVFGMTSEGIWERLLPGASDEVKKRADDKWLENELDCLAEGMGALYPGVPQSLEALHGQGFRLFVASNGQGPYVRGVLQAFGIRSWFTGIYSAGEKKIFDKRQLVALLMKEHQVTSGWMVGDRSSDVQAGKANGLTVIGCRYAGFPQFGDEKELEDADQVIHSFSELLTTRADVNP